MSSRSAVAVIRTAAVQRALLGALLLAAPNRITFAATGNHAPTWLVRVLGGRLLAQGALEYAHPSRTITLAGAAVDTTHAVSMLAAAALLPAYRRPATASAIEAAASAVVATSVVRQLP